MDVVPAGSGWDTDPYLPAIRRSPLCALGFRRQRGLQACYLVWKSSKELDFQLLRKFVFIVGTDEEVRLGRHGLLLWTCRTCKNQFGFSPDAEFPIINGETAGIPLQVKSWVQPVFTASQVVLRESCQATLNQQQRLFPGDSGLQAKLDAFVAEHKLREKFKKTVNTRLPSLLNHGACFGVNGATYLALFLNDQFDFGTCKGYLDLCWCRQTTMRYKSQGCSWSRWVPFLWMRCLPRFDETSAGSLLPSTSVIQRNKSRNQSVLESLPVASVSTEHSHTSLCANGRSLVQTLLNIMRKTNWS